MFFEVGGFSSPGNKKGARAAWVSPLRNVVAELGSQEVTTIAPGWKWLTYITLLWPTSFFYLLPRVIEQDSI